MNVLILSSSSENIEQKYIEQAQNVSAFLAAKGFNLIFGGSHRSMMGICYQEFIKRKRDVYAFTTKEYIDQLKYLEKAKINIVDTTFDLKKLMFEKSDLIICLAGGIGTLSEILSYIEEVRSNKQDKPIIIYNENNFYHNLFEQLKIFEKEKFISSNVKSFFEIVNNEKEFEDKINKLIKESEKNE